MTQTFNRLNDSRSHFWKVEKPAPPREKILAAVNKERILMTQGPPRVQGESH